MHSTYVFRIGWCVVTQLCSRYSATDCAAPKSAMKIDRTGASKHNFAQLVSFFPLLSCLLCSGQCLFILERAKDP